MAIAKKITEAHGGTIRCESEEEKGVEFILTLPLSDEPSQFSGELLSHSDDFTSKKLEIRDLDDQGDVVDFKDLIDPLQEQLQKKGLSVLIVDDEHLYQQMLERYVKQMEDHRIAIHCSIDALSALDLARKQDFDVIILDVDMGPGMDGFECSRKLRDFGIDSFICIHSNRGLLDFQTIARDAGADLFVPKPMSKSIFLKVLLSRFGNPDNLATSTTKETHNKQKAAKKLNLIVVEDENIFMKSWLKALKDESVTSFLDAEEAVEYFKTKPMVDALITDYYLGDLTGTDVAHAFLREYPDKPVFLSSNLEEDRNDNVFTACVPKIPKRALPIIRSKMFDRLSETS